ncbi:MAG: D-alanine--D-alanine ligase family protein [Bacillota bacterium]
MDKINLGLIFGGKSEEHEVSIMSARSVYKYAKKSKYNIIPIAVDKKGNWLSSKDSLSLLNNNKLKKVPESKNNVNKGLDKFLNNNFDLIFPLIHGPYGEDGKIQGFLELLEIPYIGAGVLSSAVGMDKGIMKKLFDYNNLKQTEFITVKKKNDYKIKLEQFLDKITFPLFVKPANLGSSIGISKVYNIKDLDEAIDEAFKYDSKAVIEEHINAREIECSVLGKDKIIASLPGEIIPAHDFYDYQSKYEDKKTKLVIPADLDDVLIEEIKSISIKAFEIIEGEGLARVDFFVTKDNIVYINEINTIPGFTKYSMYPKLWEASGLSYSKLIDKLVEISLS